MSHNLPAFVGGTLDRADAVRSDPDRLVQAFNDTNARRPVLDGLEPTVVDNALLMEALPDDADLTDHVLLGIDGDRPIFVAINPQAGRASVHSPTVRALADVLPPDQYALYGTARSLIDWHARHRFCSNCGSPTTPAKGGWQRSCVPCGAEHFPRVDPVVIMLAEHEGRILLGRQPRFPAGRYSALAGFVEPGETIEEAVARELWEEAGITVHSVRYVMSQPWPFPSSLMIACTAQSDTDRLTLDETEIEDAFWCDAAGVRAALAGAPDAPFVAPPRMAVAYHLLTHWLERINVAND